MMTVIDRWCRISFEQMARWAMQKPFAYRIMTDLFQSSMMFVRNPGIARQWCETSLSRGTCYMPNNQPCSSECMGQGSLATPCPPGYRPSHAWGFVVTGCWCDNSAGGGIVCCDCTPVGNSPYNRTANDCGCMHA